MAVRYLRAASALFTCYPINGIDAAAVCFPARSESILEFDVVPSLVTELGQERVTSRMGNKLAPRCELAGRRNVPGYIDALQLYDVLSSGPFLSLN